MRFPITALPIQPKSVHCLSPAALPNVDPPLAVAIGFSSESLVIYLRFGAIS